MQEIIGNVRKPGALYDNMKGWFNKVDIKKGGLRYYNDDSDYGGGSGVERVMGEVDANAPSQKYPNYGVEEFINDKPARKETVDYLEKALQSEGTNIRYFTFYFQALEAKYIVNTTCASGKKDVCKPAVEETLLATKGLINWINKNRPDAYNFNEIKNFKITQTPFISKLFAEKGKVFKNGGYNDYYDEGYASGYGGYNNNYDEGYASGYGGYNNNYDEGYASGYGGYNDYNDNMYGGDLLEQLRVDIGRPSINNAELNKFRDEINQLRN
jgi:hypothetical protein